MEVDDELVHDRLAPIERNVSLLEELPRSTWAEFAADLPRQAELG